MRFIVDQFSFPLDCSLAGLIYLEYAVCSLEGVVMVNEGVEGAEDLEAGVEFGEFRVKGDP